MKKIIVSKISRLLFVVSIILFASCSIIDIDDVRENAIFLSLDGVWVSNDNDKDRMIFYKEFLLLEWDDRIIGKGTYFASAEWISRSITHINGVYLYMALLTMGFPGASALSDLDDYLYSEKELKEFCDEKGIQMVFDQILPNTFPKIEENYSVSKNMLILGIGSDSVRTYIRP